VIAVAITPTVVLLFVVGYLLWHPEKAEKIGGWIARAFAGVHGAIDRKAVALSVQGDVNSARSQMLDGVPDGVIGGKLKVKWASAEEAQTHMRDGEVVVFMRRSRDREENVANALMAYLPRAIVPRARRYVEKETMRAVDLTLAREILHYSHMPAGALDVFYEHHLDKALATEGEMKARLEEIDAIDLHGWLTRVMLNEYRLLGDMLYPGQCDAVCLNEARELRTWLGKLAKRERDDFTTPLKFDGRYLRIGLVFVAARETIEKKGLDFYRKKAKRLIYTEKCDSVYLMARDDNIPAVHKVRDALEGDALVEAVATYEYKLRRDFAARHRLKRERAVIVAIRRRRGAQGTTGDDADVVGELASDIEVFDPESEISGAALAP
jgi:hypothetical protein